MFSQACVKNSGKGVCMVEDHAWQEGMHGEVGGGMCGRGTCMAGGHAWWGCVWQERWPLQQMVRILLECILVNIWSLFQADLSIFKSIHLFALPAIKLQAECKHNRY